jgi:hypothetical protein
MSRHPVAALALALAMTGAIAGCGVQPTGVVDAGEPAKGPLPPLTVDSEAPPVKREVGSRLYFVLGGDLQPVVRVGLPAGDPNVALAALLKGPSEVELKRGMITALPRDLGQLRLGRRTVSAVTVVLDADPRRLRRPAMLQITCTVAFALPDRLPIVLVGPDGASLAAPRCIERAPFLVDVPPT